MKKMYYIHTSAQHITVCNLSFFCLYFLHSIAVVLLRDRTLSHLFCTLISENQGLDKSRSVSNLIKISVPVHLNFFSVHLNFFFSLSPEFFSGLWYKSEKNPVDKLKKKSGLLKKKSGVQDLKCF